MAEQTPPRVRRLDARSLRGLAHPLRLEILSLLRRYGPATATSLAARLGESTGTTSWHLRQLAEHGFIAEDPDRGNRRERWWQSLADYTQLDEADLLNDPEMRGPLSVYLHAVLDKSFRTATAFVAEGLAGEWSPEWVAAADLSDYRLALTADGLAALTADLKALVERHRPATASAEPAGGRVENVAVQLQAFPMRTPAHPEAQPSGQTHNREPER